MNDEKQEISTELTLSEMKTINTIIEVSASRGIFKPSDFVVVGNIYEKIRSLYKD